MLHSSRRIERDTIALVLTATVDPGSTPYVARRDPELRLADYIASISQWSQLPGIETLVIENSGIALDELEAAIRPEVKNQFMVQSASTFNPGLDRGKGYGEMSMLQDIPKLWPAFSRTQYIAKATGRIFVENFQGIVRDVLRMDQPFVVADLRNHGSFADSRFFLARPEFFTKYLFTRAEEIDDHKGIYFEHVLAKSIADAQRDGHLWVPLPRVPRILGYDGTRNVPHWENDWIRWFIRDFNRRFFKAIR